MRSGNIPGLGIKNYYKGCFFILFDVFFGMKFEYDAIKSRSNKQKHGIDFEEAQALWEDDNYLEVPIAVAPEARFAILGKITGKLWCAVVTYRANKIRIISVRRAREKEEKSYEEDHH